MRTGFMNRRDFIKSAALAAAGFVFYHLRRVLGFNQKETHGGQPKEAKFYTRADKLIG